MTFYQGWDGPKVYAAQLGEAVEVDLSLPTPQAGIVPLRPLTVGDILSGSFRAVRFNPPVMFGLTLLIVLVSQLLATGATVVIGRQLGTGVTPITAVGGLDPSTLMVSLLSGYGATGLASLLADLALLPATVQAVLAQRIRPAAALRRLGRRLGAAIGLALLLDLVIALLLAALIPLFGQVAQTSGPEGVLGVLSLLLLVVGPIIAWLSVKLRFAYCVLAVEELGPIRSLRRSWQLTSGLFWRILGITLLVNLVVALAAGTVSQVVGGFSLLLSLTGDPRTLLITTTLTSVVSSVLSIPLVSAATALQYVDARIRREGYDITLSEAMYG